MRKNQSVSINSRKPQNLVVGKKVSQGLLSWKGADMTFSFYIGNADINTTIDDIKAGIEGQGVGVVELQEIPQRRNHSKGFKLVIRKKDVGVIKDPNFWPEGVFIRRFFH